MKGVKPLIFIDLTSEVDTPFGGIVDDIKIDDEIESEKETARDYLVYCLVSEVSPLKTYVGMTNNWKRRLRQHCGLLVGGAKTTKANRPWKGLFHIRGLTKTQALQLEWSIKHRRKGGSGPNGRVRTLEFLFGCEKWTTRSTPMREIPTLEMFTTWSEEQYVKVCGSKLIPGVMRNFSLEVL